MDLVSKNSRSVCVCGWFSSKMLIFVAALKFHDDDSAGREIESERDNGMTQQHSHTDVLIILLFVSVICL